MFSNNLDIAFYTESGLTVGNGLTICGFVFFLWISYFYLDSLLANTNRQNFSNFITNKFSHQHHGAFTQVTCLFDAFFGDNYLSWRSFLKSSFLTYLSTLIYSGYYFPIPLGDDQGIFIFCTVMVIFLAPLTNYLILIKTRWALNKIQTAKSKVFKFSFFSALFFTTLMIIMFSITFFLFIGGVFASLTGNANSVIDGVFSINSGIIASNKLDNGTPYKINVYGNLIASSFSIWFWTSIYVMSTFLAKKLNKINLILRIVRFCPPEKRPLAYLANYAVIIFLLFLFLIF